MGFGLLTGSGLRREENSGFRQTSDAGLIRTKPDYGGGAYLPWPSGAYYAWDLGDTVEKAGVMCSVLMRGKTQRIT